MTSFDFLMQNFYKVTQGNNEKVPSYVTRMEGILNQIRLQCPSRMTDLEVQQHLKDCLSHGIHKHICDSFMYLYSTPENSYFKLMVVTYKAESESEEIKDKVRARAAVTTDSGEGTAELGQQIAKLMATLTKVGQDNNPCSAPSSPLERGCGRGHNGRSTPSNPNSHNGRSVPGQSTPAHSLPTGCGMGGTRNGSNGRDNQGTSTRREATANRQDPNSFQCFRCQGWGHMARECPTPAFALNQPGGSEGMQLTPTGESTPANSRTHTFPPQPWTKASQHEDSPTNRPTRSHPSHSILKSRSHCPPAGMINEAPVIIDGQNVTILMDSRATVSTVSCGFCEHITWRSTLWADC